jgi:hypothetical protein
MPTWVPVLRCFRHLRALFALALLILAFPQLAAAEATNTVVQELVGNVVKSTKSRILILGSWVKGTRYNDPLTGGARTTTCACCCRRIPRPKLRWRNGRKLARN